jgi:hypothetical protein
MLVVQRRIATSRVMERCTAVRTTIDVDMTRAVRSRFTRGFLLFVVCCVVAVMGWRLTATYPTDVFDFYPVYFGGQAWLQVGNAYATQQIAPAYHQPWDLYRTGNMYPLPAILLGLPLSLLSPTLAATLWVGLLTAGVLLALRVSGLPLWWGFALPIVDGIRIEQYTVLIVIAQILALWAHRERRPWALAICCALILTKPNQGLFFVLVLVLLARNWRQQIAVNALVWGGSLLLDPHWVGEWLPTLDRYRQITHQPILWGFALFAIPLLLMRQWLAAATIAQFLILPFPTASTYAAGAVPLTLLDDPRSKWLTLLSYVWVVPALFFGPAWATALTILLPMVLLAALRHYEGRSQLVATGRSGPRRASIEAL